MSLLLLTIHERSQDLSIHGLSPLFMNKVCTRVDEYCEPRSGELLDGVRGFGGREPPENFLPVRVYLDYTWYLPVNSPVTNPSKNSE